MDKDIANWAEANRKRLKMTQAEVGRLIGVSQPQAQKRLSGDMEFTIAEVRTLSKHFGVNSPVAKFQDSPETSSSSPWATVPEYDVSVSAGDGAIVEAENIKTRWPFDPDYLEGELSVSADHLAIVEVTGDSMYPTLTSGEKVMVDLRDLNVSQPGIFVVYDGSGTVVKRLERVYDAPEPTIALISDNERHRRYEVPADQISVVGRVIWAARRL